MNDAIAAPDDAVWGHRQGPGADGLSLHYVESGSGAPVLLLHGWPGFWYDWRAVIPALAAKCRVIAPDLRGFGRSDKPVGDPSRTYAPAVMASDLLCLLDHLGIERILLVAHDVGAIVAQTLARTAPARFPGLVLFNPPYPGIGARRYQPEVVPDFWYQHFHTLSWASDLIGHDRTTVRIYLRHFYDHWVGRKEMVRPAEFEAIVDAYSRPGAVAASIAFYRARAAGRSTEARSDPATLQVPQPTLVYWGADDPVLRVAWADRLRDFFPALVDLKVLNGIGHFVPFEAPDDTLEAVSRQLYLMADD